MNKIIILLVCTVVFCSCSIYEAVHAPEPVEYKKMHVGMGRTETIELLGYPKMTDVKNDQKIDTFEFVDGYNPVSKGRIILYLAGDIFTVGLAEIIFWPLESNAFEGKQCKGTVNYDIAEKVSNFNIVDKKGLPLWSPEIALKNKPK